MHIKKWSILVGDRRRRRWRIPFRRSSAAARKNEPPQEFVCPIANSLMYDPVVVGSGQTFDRVCVDACRNLSFTPALADGSKPDLSTVIPNLALKAAILNWCDKTGAKRPEAPVYSDVESIIRAAGDSSRNLETRSSESELLEAVAEKPRVSLSHAATELNTPNLYASWSSDESVVANLTPFLPFATRPSCFLASAPDEVLEINDSTDSSTKNENFVVKMVSSDVSEQEEAVILLRKTTRNSEESRSVLCSARVLLTLRGLLISRYSAVQTNAAAVVVNLSLEKVNKIRIVRAGIVPPLIDILKYGLEESREHAAGAIFSLALEDENKTVIGVLGALQPLLHELRSGTERSRHDAALALYHLTLVQGNRQKVVKLGAAAPLLGLLKDASVAARVALVLCNLAACEEGRTALLGANAVQRLVDALRNMSDSGNESSREGCVAALHALSHKSLRFKTLAIDAGAVEVLRGVAEKGTERARKKAQRMLEGLTVAPRPADGAEIDWEAVIKNGVGVAWPRRAGSRNSV